MRQVPPIIDPEFQRLIPPLEASELWQLEENIRAHGCRDPLVLWHGILLDGHNRLRICLAHKLPYTTVEILLPSRDHALLWMELNQLGRRNLKDDQRGAIGFRVEKRLVAIAKLEQRRAAGKRGGRGKKKSGATAVVAPLKLRTVRIVTKVAKKAGVSERKLRTVREIAKKRGEEAVDQIAAGEKTIAEIKTEIRRAERAEKLALIAAVSQELPDRKFAILYADPPWRYEFSDEARAIENQYPTLTLEELSKKPIQDVALDDALLFLWATSPKLEEAIELAKAWGFTYRTSMVWVKDQIGMGYYARQQHELLLICKRGELPAPDPFLRPSSVINAPRLEHSAKPPVVREIIDRMYPGIEKLELFARGPLPAGWSGWGNQAEAAP